MATDKEIVESIYASFATGDVPAVLGVMAEDIQWTEATDFHLLARTSVLRRCSKATLCDSRKSVMTTP